MNLFEGDVFSANPEEGDPVLTSRMIEAGLDAYLEGAEPSSQAWERLRIRLEATPRFGGTAPASSPWYWRWTSVFENMPSLSMAMGGLMAVSMGGLLAMVVLIVSLGLVDSSVGQPPHKASPEVACSVRLAGTPTPNEC